MSQSSHRVGFVLLDGFELLDFAGPHAVFDAANLIAPGSYDLLTLGPSADVVTGNGAARVLPTHTLAQAPDVETLVLPGGGGIRTGPQPADILGPLKRKAESAQRVVSICTGAFLIARLGLAQGRTLATHWRHAEELARLHPDISVDARSLYRQDGALYSSAGVTAGIDLALALVAEDLGPAIAAAIARQLVVHFKRSGDQAQYHEHLAALQGRSARFAALIEWIKHNIARPLGVPVLAHQAGMSERSFTRAFQADFQITPARYVELVRLDQACGLLSDPTLRIDAIAQRTGFSNPDSFRRAFERRFGVSPRFYRNRFHTHAE